MTRTFRNVGTGLALALNLLCLATTEAQAQGRGNRNRPAAAASGGFTLTVEVKSQIREFYAARSESAVEALPPGIRRNLERGKALPPGIAKKSAPAELQTRLELVEGYELVEVGLDVFLVEVATGIIHDVLMDLIR